MISIYSLDPNSGFNFFPLGNGDKRIPNEAVLGQSKFLPVSLNISVYSGMFNTLTSKMLVAQFYGFFRLSTAADIVMLELCCAALLDSGVPQSSVLVLLPVCWFSVDLRLWVDSKVVLLLDMKRLWHQCWVYVCVCGLPTAVPGWGHSCCHRFCPQPTNSVRWSQ